MNDLSSRKTRLRVYYDPRSLPLAANAGKVTRLFVEDGVSQEPYHVTIKPFLGRYELKGTVDSQLTKQVVLSIVQTNHPYREFIDHMTIIDANSHEAQAN